MSKTGRNDPCPCGSGKKYKKCCLQNEHVSTGREESIKKRLNSELLKLFDKLVSDDMMEDAIHEFWGDFDPSPQPTKEELAMADINFHEWIVHDWADEVSEKFLIDLYIEASRVLPIAERKVLDMMNSSVLSLFEVQEVFPDKGLLIKDLLLGGEHDVREKAATASLRKWDILAARILELDGQKILSGAVYPYPLRMKEEIMGDYKAGFGKYHRKFPELTMRDFLKDNGGHYCNSHWCDIIGNPQKPRLTNTDGHQMVISKAYYEINDKGAALESLREINVLFECEEGGGFDWLGKENKDGHSTLLGRVHFKKERMVLEANSRERLKKGKALIKRRVPGAVYQADAFEDIEKSLQSRQGRHEEPAPEIPSKVPL